MAKKPPDRLYIEKKDRPVYDKLKSVELLKDKETKDLFLIAMTYGFKNETRRPLETRDGFVRTEYLRPRELALINAIALSQGGLEVLDNQVQVFSMVEEYANAGIKLLTGAIEAVSFGSYEKQLEKEIAEIYSELFA